MFAIIKTGGKQYRVAAGDTLKVEKLPGSETLKAGDKVTFDEVLLIDNGSETTLGTPLLKGAKVTATFQKNARAAKVLIGKFKSKTRFRKTQGHRQHYSAVKIDSIGK